MTKYKADSAVQKKYDKLVLELLSMKFLPFNLFNSQEWRSLISFLDKRLNLKDRTTYSRQMKDIAREVQDKVKKMIKEFCGDSLAITSDMWSSRVLAHFISFRRSSDCIDGHPSVRSLRDVTLERISRPSWTSSWRSCPLTRGCTRHVCLTMQQPCYWGSGLVN